MIDIDATKYMDKLAAYCRGDKQNMLSRFAHLSEFEPGAKTIREYFTNEQINEAIDAAIERRQSL